MARSLAQQHDRGPDSGFEIVKNFFTGAELVELVGRAGTAHVYEELDCFWLLAYEVTPPA